MLAHSHKSQGWHIPQLHINPNATLAAIVDPSEKIRSTLNPDIKQMAELQEEYQACVNSLLWLRIMP